MSDISKPVKRILAQGIQTSVSRKPIIGLLIRTNNGYYTESLLHKRLYQYRMFSDCDGVGDEWFLTNPSEVENILINDVMPKSNNSVKYCEYEILNTENLGEVLDLHRKKLNLTNEKMAKMVGVSRDTLWRFFSGDKMVCIDTLTKVLDVLGLEITLKSRLPADKLKIYKSLRKVR